jgi:putative ABC transport system permease protein
VQSEVVRTLERAGPTTFYIMRAFFQGDPNNLPPGLRNRPTLEESEAERIAALPSIKYASIWAQLNERLEYQGVRSQPIMTYGADDGFAVIHGGDLVEGRWFTRSELHGGAAVAVITRDQAEFLFGRGQPLGKQIRVGGRPAIVVGIYEDPGNIFTPQGQEVGAIIPFRFALHSLAIDKRLQLLIAVKPRDSVTVDVALADATVAMREARHLRPSDPNSFDMMSQDQILSTFNSIGGAFFLVMMVLASVALMVGGIGVMAVMMVSVTARTREIGVRKALGATRADILAQFLVEAATLSGIGGLFGIALGLIAGRVGMAVMKIQGVTPVGLTLTAVGVSVGIGLVFGVLPAVKAAQLDPIDALRYE